MKITKLTKIWNSICQFFRGFTKAGKDEKYYDEALKNMQGPEALFQFQKRVLQYEINEFLNGDRKIRILPEPKKLALVKNKFAKQMKELELTICPETNKLIDA